MKKGEEEADVVCPLHETIKDEIKELKDELRRLRNLLWGFLVSLFLIVFAGLGGLISAWMRLGGSK